MKFIDTYKGKVIQIYRRFFLDTTFYALSSLPCKRSQAKFLNVIGQIDGSEFSFSTLN